MSKTELYLSKIIQYGLYAILLTPLVFWAPALYGFMTPKFILFQALVEIVFAAWLILIIYQGKLAEVISNLRRNYIAAALVAFIAFSFISALLGIDFSRSFWGIGARMTGLFAALHFLAWFLVLTGVTTQHNPNLQIYSNSTNNDGSIRSIRMPFVDWNHYINFSFAVSILVAISAFYQNAGWRLVYGSTFFNNPTFAAPYFLFHFFWGLYQIWKSQSFNKLFFGIGSILILTALLLGEVRGAIIGLITGILFLGIGLIFSGVLSSRRRVVIVVFYLLLLLGAVSLWQWRNTALFQNVDILKKFSEISTSATTKTRILLWKTSLKGFFDRPLFGTGPENFNYLFNAHYNPRFLKYGGGGFDETWQDKPHNAFLEVLTETGIIGVLAYIAIWLAAAFYLFKIFKNGLKFLSLILVGMFTAYLTAMFFSFDSFGSWFGLFLFLAFLASYSSNTNDTNEHTNNTNKTLKNFPLGNLFVAFVLIGALVLEYFNYNIWRANLSDADALRIFPRNPAEGIVLFKKSLHYFTPYKSEYQFDLIASVAGAIEKRLTLPNLEDSINFSLDETDKAITAHPRDATKYTDMARVYNILGTAGRDLAILGQAETFGKKSLELSPNRQEALFYLARTALLKNDFKSAVELTKRAVSVDSEVGLSHWYLGLSYIADNRRNEGVLEIKKAIELGYKPQSAAEKDFIRNIGL